ncbi:UNVERIFIED_CONTAM: hypothetical protein RMT77_010045 [Armadillidium vulgare]
MNNLKGCKPKLNKPFCQDLRTLSSEELKQVRCRLPGSNPFEGMKIKNGAFLDKLDGRTLCKKCGKSRKYFCYSCYIPLPEIENDIPVVKLPCFIDIIKHPRETDGKSTAIHASIIAAESVSLYTFPDIPHYNKEENVFLIFPDKNAIPLEDFSYNKYLGKCENKSEGISKNGLPPLRIIFIDSTWNQTKRIHGDERLKDLQCLQLTTRETLFWRYQKGKPKTYLSTIEAIYYFVKDFHLKFISDNYEGEYDNLLFFFKYMYEKIHTLYDPVSLLAYKE